MHKGTALLTTAHLKERGWTPALVKKFLDVPDATKPIPYYRLAAPGSAMHRTRGPADGERGHDDERGSRAW
jgi:hypothetical protein